MYSSQSKTARYAKKQENMTHNKVKKKKNLNQLKVTDDRISRQRC